MLLLKRRPLVYSLQALELGTLSRNIVVVFVVSDSVRELQAKDIVSIKPISLKSVDNNSSLQSRFKIRKTKDDLFSRFLFPRNETNGFEA